MIGNRDYIQKLEEACKIATFIPVIRERIKEIRKLKTGLSSLKGKIYELNEILEEDLKIGNDKLFQTNLWIEIKELVFKITAVKLRFKTLWDHLYVGDNFVLEVSSGVGGREAEMFARELFQKYKTILNQNVSIIPDSQELKMIINKDWNARLRFEAGIHRVQRVPTSEASGRVHTSTVGVSITSKFENFSVNISSEDLRIETMRSSGAGGQHVNTTNSAVRITHLPTLISSRIGTSREQIDNREIALNNVKDKLLEFANAVFLKNWSESKHFQTFRKDRTLKIRTFNFPQGRITDHRIPLTRNLKEIWESSYQFEKFIQEIASLLDRR